jgi:hypothetical protein
MRWYSSGLRPWDAINSGVMAGSVMAASFLGERASLLGQVTPKEKGQEGDVGREGQPHSKLIHSAA